MYESFLYRKEKAAGDKIYWMCRDQARMGCRSRAITQGQQVTVMRGHCHSPDLAGLEALRQRERLPSPPQQEDPGTDRGRGGGGDMRAVGVLVSTGPRFRHHRGALFPGSSAFFSLLAPPISLSLLSLLSTSFIS